MVLGDGDFSFSRALWNARGLSADPPAGSDSSLPGGLFASALSARIDFGASWRVTSFESAAQLGVGVRSPTPNRVNRVGSSHCLCVSAVNACRVLFMQARYRTDDLREAGHEICHNVR